MNDIVIVRFSKMSKLFDDDDQESGNFNINTDYAKNYDKWRQKEEINKCKITICNFFFIIVL